MIRVLDLVKQQCAPVARLGNLESKPRYSYRLTDDIRGTGPSLKCRLSVSRSNTRLPNPPDSTPRSVLRNVAVS